MFACVVLLACCFVRVCGVCVLMLFVLLLVCLCLLTVSVCCLFVCVVCSMLVYVCVLLCVFGVCLLLCCLNVVFAYDVMFACGVVCLPLLCGCVWCVVVDC